MALSELTKKRLWWAWQATKSRQWIVNASEEKLARAISRWYEVMVGKPANLDNPTTFNEKIQWLKAHDFDSRKVECSDKVGVRSRIAETVGPEVLLEQYAVWSSANDIDLSGISRPFMLKSNNGSGYYLLVDESCDIDQIREKAAQWLKANFAFVSMERHYALIPPRIFAEEYLDDIVFEYQVWCFDGKAQFVAAIVSPHGVNEKRFFSPDWQEQPFVSSKPIYEGEIERPECLDDIITFSEKLTEGFTFVRVDWYWSATKGLKFSEMTFTPAGGNILWYPEEYDTKLGPLIHIEGIGGR